MSSVNGDTIDISVIVVSYNSEGRIGQAIRDHTAALGALSGEILVIDNASADLSVEEATAAMTNGRVIANSENVGYGKAANQGIRAAAGRTCLILNDDARIDSGSLSILMSELLSDEAVAMVGPRIVGEDGQPMPSARTAFPGPGEELERLADVLRRRNRNSVYPAPTDEPLEVAWLVAACVLARTDVLRRVGGFNPAFFLYSEDIDLARRLREEGYRILTVPRAECVHIGSVATGTAWGEGTRIGRRTEARDLYYRIWQPRAVRSLIHLRRAIGLSNQPDRLRHHLPKVIWDGPSMGGLRKPPPLEGDSG